MQIYGRKVTSVLLNLITLVGSIIIAMAPDITTLIAGRCVQGIAFGGWYLCCIIVAEYSHPTRRGFFIVFKAAASTLGELLCHGLGLTFLNWRQIVWITALPSLLAILITLKWPESPSFLAYKGRYEECTAAFQWLRGKDCESRKELKELISAQQELKKLNDSKIRNSANSIFNAFCSKNFLRPLLIVTVLVILFQACGTYYLAVYIVDIIEKITEDRTIAYYYTIGLDFLKTIAFILSAVVVRLCNRRAMMFWSGASACMLMASICVLNYLDEIEIVRLKWLTPSILIAYYVLCCFSILPITTVAKGEMFPIQYKGLGTCVTGILLSLTSIATLKWTMTMIVVINLHGTFAVYLSICIATLVCLYFIMPETRDRTLQDIEIDFLDVKLEANDDPDATRKLFSTPS